MEDKKEEMLAAIKDLEAAYKKYRTVKGTMPTYDNPMQVVVKTAIFAGETVVMRGEELILEMIFDKLNS